MINNDNEHVSISIGNAIRSLYQLIVLVEENTHSCNIIDYDNEVHNLCLDKANFFNVLCDHVYRNIHPEDREAFNILTNTERIHTELSDKVSISAECRIRHSDFKYYWTKITICNAKFENSSQGKEYLFLLEDVHQQKSKEKAEINELLAKISRLEGDYAKLFAENMTDQLTGCYNRKGLKYYEAQVIEDARKQGKSIFVCVLDLNGLKYLNDTYGHSAGDEAIKTVSDALKQSMPPDAKIVRTGGDEFLIFCTASNDENYYDEIGNKIDTFLKDYNDAHSNPFDIAASYGYVIANITDETDNIDEFISAADKNMYHMKEEKDPHKR